MTNGTDSYDEDQDGLKPFSDEWYADWCRTKIWLFNHYDKDGDQVLTAEDAVAY